MFHQFLTDSPLYQNTHLPFLNTTYLDGTLEGQALGFVTTSVGKVIKSLPQTLRLTPKSANKTATPLCKQSLATYPAAQWNLKKKLLHLQNIQNSATKIKNLSDGRIRYYRSEIPSHKPGFTKGSSYVVEYNPKNGQVRSWQECYDNYGFVNRIHPKTIDGQQIFSQHYPPTQKELNLYVSQKFKGKK